MSQHDDTGGWTTIRTALPTPLPPNPSRAPVATERLILRPFAPSDVAAIHALHRQPEVMRWTRKGRPDADEAETARWLARFLPPNDARTFNWAICLRAGPGEGEGEDEGEGEGEGELIGVGGVHDFGDGGDDDDGFGWPEVGYLLRREYWGQGLGTEFLRGFLGAYRQLRREVLERRVKAGSFVSAAGGGGAAGDEGAAAALGREQLVAVIDRTNGASRRVLEKSGFQGFADFEERDNRDPEKVIELVAYRYFPDATS